MVYDSHILHLALVFVEMYSFHVISYHLPENHNLGSFFLCKVILHVSCSMPGHPTIYHFALVNVQSSCLLKKVYP